MTTGFRPASETLPAFSDDDRRKGKELIRGLALSRYGFQYRGVMGGPADPAIVRHWFLSWVNARLDAAEKHAAKCGSCRSGTLHCAARAKMAALEDKLAGAGWVRE